MPFTEINGKKVYYELHGEGKTIALLHHGFSSSKMWNGIYPKLVDAGYQILMYDRRGFGQSEPGDDFREFYEGDGIRDASAMELATLADTLGIDAFSIVGQCEGGVVGVNFAYFFPNRVNGLVIASTYCHSGTEFASSSSANPSVSGEV